MNTMADGEREKFEAYRGGDFERDAKGYYLNVRTSQDWAMWQAAAQQSQAAQGDALADEIELIRAVLDGYPESIARSDALRATRVIRAALAASKPHGEDSCESVEDELQFYREEAFNLPNILIGAGVFTIDHEGDYKAAWANIMDAIERLAAREPVVEPVCTDCGTPLLYECVGCSKMNYPAPAQAVDLGQFREAVEMAMETPLNSIQRERLVRLLALIDKAVGK